MADSPYIIEVTRENFQELMGASFKVPVLLDFLGKLVPAVPGTHADPC